MSVRINRVYTRSGDDGQTGLVGGERISKASLRVASYGDVDELNSVLGLVRAYISVPTAELDPILEQIQQELFDLGSELATLSTTTYPGKWETSAADVTRLESLCDRFGDGLPELTSFILPGGSIFVSYLHLARTVARRAERTIVALSNELSSTEATPGALTLNPEIIKYINRLNDLLFIFARWGLEKEQVKVPLWIPAKDRKTES